MEMKQYLFDILQRCSFWFASTPSSSPISLWPPVRPVVTANHRNARSIKRNNVRRAVCRTNGLRSDQHNIDELSHKHKTKRTEFHQTNGRIAEIEAIHSEHAQEHGEQQCGVEVIAISKRETNAFI